jgi:hypothetical protein
MTAECSGRFFPNDPARLIHSASLPKDARRTALMLASGMTQFCARLVSPDGGKPFEP